MVYFFIILFTSLSLTLSTNAAEIILTGNTNQLYNDFIITKTDKGWVEEYTAIITTNPYKKTKWVFEVNPATGNLLKSRAFVVNKNNESIYEIQVLFLDKHFPYILERYNKQLLEEQDQSLMPEFENE